MLKQSGMPDPSSQSITKKMMSGDREDRQVGRLA